MPRKQHIGRTTLGPRGRIVEASGFDLLGAEEDWNVPNFFPEVLGPRALQAYGEENWVGQVVMIPTAGANYTDAKTVAAVQQALVNLNYDLGKSGPKGDGVDGMFGSKTKAAINKWQSDVGIPETGKIDEGVIGGLKVTPGVLPPGVSLQQQAALQAQVALDAATLAEHASTPADVQTAADQASQAAAAAAPPPPPEVQQKLAAATAQAKAAKTPDQVKAAAKAVQSAAQDVHAAVKPSWWVEPAWNGGWPRWEVTLAGGAGTVGLAALLAVLL